MLFALQGRQEFLYLFQYKLITKYLHKLISRFNNLIIFAQFFK